MRVIVLATQKGGAGKTTLCGHLAVEAERAGAGPVALIDADPQSSLSDWWNAREKETPMIAQIGQGGLKQTLVHLGRQHVTTVLIDTPGRADSAISKIISAADLVLVPVVPSPHDLRAINKTIAMVEEHEVPMVFVVNNAGAGRLTTQAAVVLSQHGTVAPAICRTRQDFRASMIKGQTVMETAPHGKSADEVSELWTYIESILAKGKRRGRKIID
jgi:chromosome partitioning protein